MLDRLYPPYIEGTIPAFYGTVGMNASDVEYRLTVPFSMNKGVGIKEINGFRVRIKNIQSNNIVAEITKYVNEIQAENIASTGEVSFTFKNSDLTAGNSTLLLGQSFKIQLAYLNKNNVVGYFSTVGVAKYTTKPQISIKGLKGNAINSHTFEYTGEYSQKGQDTTEKLYSSKFIITDANGKIVEDSGNIIHNITKDSAIDTAIETWQFGKSLQTNVPYYIRWEVTTSNNLTLSTMNYRIMDKESISPHLNADLIAKLNFDNGYVDLRLESYLNDEGKEIPSSGLFLLSRRDDSADGKWEELYRFALFSEIPSKKLLFRDYTIKQGTHYTYALQQYNNHGLYSNRIYHKLEDAEGNITDEVLYADFEDAFLFDGKRQLKIRYNPQMNSFTRNLQESTTATIGSKFPFVFRNGAVDYKSFPIGGLISYYMDEENLFLSPEEFSVQNKTTCLTSENIAAEREFKMKVYEWLSDGNPKLFRSPSEGNFIVRLMQSSLSPNPQLGRMLHSFTTQATEIAEYNYQSLNQYNFIETTDKELNEVSWKSVLLSGYDEELYSWVRQAILGARIPKRYYNTIKNSLWGTDVNTQNTEANKYFTRNEQTDEIYITKGFRSTIYKVDNQGRYVRDARGNLIDEPYGELQDLILRTVMYAAGPLNDAAVLSFSFTDVLPGTIVQIDDISYMIGATGSYSLTAPMNEPYSVISVPDNARYRGVFTYAYNQSAPSTFDLVVNVSIEDVPSKQFIGPVNGEIYSCQNSNLHIENTHNIADLIQDVKTELSEFYKLNIYKKETQPLFIEWNHNTNQAVNNNKFYLDAHCTEEITVANLDEFTIYEVRKQNKLAANVKNEQLYLDANAQTLCPIVYRGYVKDEVFVQDNISYKFWLNDNPSVDLTVTNFFTITELETFDYLEIGNGLIAELSYQAKIIDYSTETTSSVVSVIKAGYDMEKEQLENLYASLNSGQLSDVQINNILQQIETRKININNIYIQLIKALVVELEADRRALAE